MFPPRANSIYDSSFAVFIIAHDWCKEPCVVVEHVQNIENVHRFSPFHGL